MKIIENKFYGDNTRWWMGVVISTRDPLMISRVQVRIHGIHTGNRADIPDADLPWASIVLPPTEGGVSGIGANSQIEETATVIGIFADGKSSQIPIVLGTIPRYEGPNVFSTNSINQGTTGYGEVGPDGIIEYDLSDITLAELENYNELSSIGLTGNNNNEIAFNFFIEAGFTDWQAAGIVGNLSVESGVSLGGTPPFMNPKAEAGGSERSRGIAQWNPSIGRLQKLQKFASNHSLPWDEMKAQLLYLMYELTTQEFLGLGPLTRSMNVETATTVFKDQFERPAGTGNITERIDRAKQILTQYG